MPELPRTCVIGAGVSGLTAGKALTDWGVPYTCFESSDDVGGNWYFRNPNGRSSAYRSLHIDTSKPSISFKDFPMPDHFPDYPHHTEIAAWLRDYADAFGLRERIRFHTTVQRAERLGGGGWRIVLDSGAEELFDALLVCNGHHWDPAYPDFPGDFDGDTLHSHHYIDVTEPLDLRDRRVLVVGIGNSAVDIASELSRKGVAEQVFISTRSGAWVMPKYIFGKPADQVVATIPWLSLKLQRRLAAPLPRLVSGKMESFGLPTPNHRFLEAHPTVSSELLLRLGSGDAVAKPDVAELLGDRVRFEDGSIERVDAIVYATGYRISFPFFDPAFLSAPANRLPLYKRMFKPGIDDLAFVGLAQAIPTLFPFAEGQSKLLARWLAGEWALPTPEEMEREIAADERRFIAHFNARPRHTMQTDARVYEYELNKQVLPAGRKRAAEGKVVPLAGRAKREGERAAAA
jgi:cation diffusion facilitator CzcD-associated flavoprotein CzcO